MIALDVFFREYNANYTDGTAILYENLITNKVKLILNNHLVINEIQTLVDRAVSILKTRYNVINVNIHWNTAQNEEVDENVVTSK